jgi:DNA-binding NarL/FixJ family response regulator
VGRVRSVWRAGSAPEWIVQGDPFDVALLDYQMPEMDGVALAREIRAVPGAQTPVLIHGWVPTAEPSAGSLRLMTGDVLGSVS